MPLSCGARLGPYEIVAPLGAGGMGEVYLASDTNLGRQVAIKVLPEALAFDPERLIRFDHEARTLSALNHPNTASIYGLERDGGRLALVMELVEGPTLADMVARAAGARRDRPHRVAGRRRPRGRARPGHRASRSEAGQRQGPQRRHGCGT
jgi:hypothetical protein